MKVADRMAELIRAKDEVTLEIAGCEVSVDSARQWENRLRSTLTRRFLERRPNATEHTWHHFHAQLGDYARRMDGLSEAHVADLVRMIDGL